MEGGPAQDLGHLHDLGESILRACLVCVCVSYQVPLVWGVYKDMCVQEGI